MHKLQYIKIHYITLHYMLAASAALRATPSSASAVQWYLSTSLVNGLLTLCSTQQQPGADVTAVVHEMN
jgi:hypothetical protein